MQRPAPRLLWKLGSWCERCPAKGGEVEARRTWRRMRRMRERRRRERRVEADTLGNLYNYPQGQPEAAGGGTRGQGSEQKGGRGWLSVEKAGAHTSIRGTTPRSQGSFVISQSYCHPSTTLRSLLQPPLFLLSRSPLPRRPLFHGQLSACLQCSGAECLCRRRRRALKPPTCVKFDAPRTRESCCILSRFSNTN